MADIPSQYLIEPVNHIAVGYRNLNNTVVGYGIRPLGPPLHITVLICGPCHRGRSDGLPHARWVLKDSIPALGLTPYLGVHLFPLPSTHPMGKPGWDQPQERTACGQELCLELSATGLFTTELHWMPSSNQPANPGQQIWPQPHMRLWVRSAYLSQFWLFDFWNCCFWGNLSYIIT